MLKVWVNTTLGETWVDKGEAPHWQRLFERKENYLIGVVPFGGLVLTAGVDAQKDRIEVPSVMRADFWDKNSPGTLLIERPCEYCWLVQYFHIVLNARKLGKAD